MVPCVVSAVKSGAVSLMRGIELVSVAVVMPYLLVVKVYQATCVFGFLVRFPRTLLCAKTNPPRFGGWVGKLLPAPTHTTADTCNNMSQQCGKSRTYRLA